MHCLLLLLSTSSVLGTWSWMHSARGFCSVWNPRFSVLAQYWQVSWESPATSTTVAGEGSQAWRRTRSREEMRISFSKHSDYTGVVCGESEQATHI